ncbi:hypothetical protein CIPAW_01G200700 [Carya illinoinensis]|uniref:Uncharacterized protein n=1 Tax=Carya illinoinensis TaxID=32201 RepID=A0A8T1RNV4_CARIL|nr:hypothetical protein CIPAW_01G200700 [Carya illinoinensis]
MGGSSLGATTVVLARMPQLQLQMPSYNTASSVATNPKARKGNTEQEFGLCQIYSHEFILLIPC